MRQRRGRRYCVIVLLWSMVVAFPKVVLGAHVMPASTKAGAHHHDELALNGGHAHDNGLQAPLAAPHGGDHLHESGYPAHHLPLLIAPVLLTPVPYHYSELPYIEPPPRRPPRLS